MNTKVYDIQNREEFNMAGSYDLIKMVPVEGSHPLFIQKYILEILTWGIANKEFIHLSGPTGSAKSSLVEAISRQPENFRLLCQYLGLAYKPIVLFENDMVLYETPGELYQRRSIKNHETIDLESFLVRSLSIGMTKCSAHYILIYLKEMGRVINATIQNGLLNLMSKSTIVLPNQQKIDGSQISYIADSNYQASEDAEHTLVQFDTALKRRFTLNIHLEYLSEQDEIVVLQQVLEPGYKKLDKKLIENIVRLGKVVRQYKAEGTLTSVVPPTIYGYLTCYRMAVSLSVNTEIVIMNTLLGNASTEDQKLADSIIQNVFNSTRTSKSQYTFLEDAF
jgi:hypothetical protein